ncbi:MAG: DinB family protein [Caldilineales bacterium]|nr:DinB family protein [Caldilineales bacterium]
MTTDMETIWQTSIWRQFGAAIDTLKDAIVACPDPLWRGRLWDAPDDRPEFTEFWYLAFHTLFWLDRYLSGADPDFSPPPPFTRDEMDPAGLLPPTIYTKEELLTYLAHGRSKCETTIATMTEERAMESCDLGWIEFSFAELLLYNMRHVQEHAAQFSLYLGQQTGHGIDWVARANR